MGRIGELHARIFLEFGEDTFADPGTRGGNFFEVCHVHECELDAGVGNDGVDLRRVTGLGEAEVFFNGGLNLACLFKLGTRFLVENAEQQVANDIGIFARASWNDGQNEILSFTDIDSSLSAGVSIKGSYWGRPSDTVGLGGAINGLSGAHRDFLAAGGLGLLIGDGRLSYRPEQILETYYAYAIDKNFTITADYQLITNPAYNADRGPVSIFSGRLHGEF